MIREKLIELGACREARRWVGDCDLESAWAECPRADWLLWLAGRVGVDRRSLVGAAAAVARDVLPVFEDARPGDNRVRACLDACKRFAAGEEIDLRPYAEAAYAAARAAGYAAAYAAARAAYYTAAAATAYAAADAAYYVADAAYFAAAAADATTRARHVEIARSKISVEQIARLL